MKKRVLTMFLALVLCIGLAVPAFAADNDFVIENGVLTKYIGPGSQYDIDPDGIGSGRRPGGDIVIPDGVTEIGEYALSGCWVSSITIPNSVTTIGEGAFGLCKASSIIIPNSVTKIGASAFQYAQVPNLIIPDNVTEIGPAVFHHCDLLTSVTIPGGVTTISNRAFAQCYGLTNVTICNGVKEIGEWTFGDCENLTSVTIPGSATTIGEDSFGECDSLTIHGEQGSYAERYAKANGIPFVADGTSQPATSTFTDVPSREYFAEPVKWAVENKITNGTSATTFSPSQDCTQAQILTFLYRADRGADATASADDMAKAVSWAREKGMIDASFDGTKLCTRATAVSYIWQALGKESAKPSSFTDVPASAAYAKAVDWAVANGITNGDGSDAIFSPDKVCNRGQIVTFLHRAYVEEARLTVK